MLFEIYLTLTAIALTLLLTSILLKALNKNNTMPLIASGLILLSVGILIASDNIQTQTGSPCINKTTETSHVWNCSTNEQGCIGTPEEKSCYYYNTTQCEAIPGCEWIGNYCYGTPEYTCTELYNYGGPEKCNETKGCYLQNESNPQTCDKYITYYDYGTCYNNYTNITSNPTNENTNTINITQYTLILLGLFLILWAASNYQQKD